MIILLSLLIAIAVLIEGTLTTLPLTLVCLICFTIIRRDTSVFLPAFLAGIVIDIFRVQQIGSTSIFYLFFLLFILLYKKKYEIYSAPYAMLATFFGTFFFLLVFGLKGVLIQSSINAVIAFIAFTGLRVLSDILETRKKERFLPL